jgi:A/G-specific adenine glycosylase
MLQRSTVKRDLDIRRALIAWFGAGHRDLLWRRTRDPYAVWISEIMLQQTRVETVTPYFARWMQRFPTVHALAQAPLDDVLAHWAGLGYYARARHLHAAAQAIVSTHNGVFPSQPAAVRALPGVGAYTAGAILSIAFAQAEPIVDGNVVRVLARVDALAGAADERALVARVWQRAAELVRADGGGDAGDFNQAMMELGAVVCAPRAPDCAACPLSRLCRAHADGDVERFPAPKTKKPPRPVDAITVLAERDGQVLLVRRKPSGLWGGLWEPPVRQLARGEPHDEAAARAAAASIGLRLFDIQSLGRFEHVLTHRRMRFYAFAARARGTLRLDEQSYDAYRWQPRGAIDVGVAAWTRRLLERQLMRQTETA